MSSMSMIWYPAVAGIESAFEIAVENPGHGWLWMRAVEADQLLGLELEGWEVTLDAAGMGSWLAELTRRALDPNWTSESALNLPRVRRRGDMPHWVTQAVAAGLLPAFQAAVLLAAAGTDRYERIHVDDDEGPLVPVCSNCDEGSLWASSVATSTWCTEHGHTPFGHVEVAGGWTSSPAWETALERHQRKHARWAAWREAPGAARAVAAG